MLTTAAVQPVSGGSVLEEDGVMVAKVVPAWEMPQKQDPVGLMLVAVSSPMIPSLEQWMAERLLLLQHNCSAKHCAYDIKRTSAFN